MNNIQTFEDACRVLSLDPTACLPDVSMMPADDQAAITAHCKLIIIAKALNGGWQPDWSNHSQGKYYPWFDVKADKDNPSGLGLSYHDFVRTYSVSLVGSRLCYRTSELAKYAGNQFKDLYTLYFLYQGKKKCLYGKLVTGETVALQFASERARISHEYCESKGWSTDLNDLSWNQIFEIRSQPAWIAAGK